MLRGCKQVRGCCMVHCLSVGSCGRLVGGMVDVAGEGLDRMRRSSPLVGGLVVVRGWSVVVPG